MKIVHMSSVHPWNDTRIFIKMCKSLAAAGHEVHWVVPRNDATAVQTVDGVVIHAVEKSRNRLKRMLQTTENVLKTALTLNGDLYHFHDAEFLRLIPRYQKMTGKTFIYDAHEDIREAVEYKKYLPRPLRKLLSWYVGKVEDRVSRLIPVISATPHISRRFKHSPHSVTINNYPLRDELSAGNAGQNLPETGRFIYVGGITQPRGIENMIRAAAATDGASITLCGNWSSPQFREQCLDGIAPDKVIERGFLNRMELAGELAQAQAGVVLFLPGPNHTCSQPNKMFEYMAAQKPLIASNFPLWQEIIEKNRCGLCVDPNSVTAIAAAMEYLRIHPEEAAAMGVNGRRAVMEQYNWESEFQKLLSFYHTLMTEKQGS